ncbi:MAG: cytochrome d ubiquinol oxidase subunit II [Gammaproteobacteria bacterium]|nr:cytochrome d ubiquinol oxidase subunit II [Gammaproteobacteria bacterium]
MVDLILNNLPIVFFVLMGVSMAIYAVLDGYDLGVGILLRFTDSHQERDRMIASIGPFWDANETWLVLGVGLLLVAFPQAHGLVLGTLYLPVAVMLIGLILRGVAFDFRAKAGLWQKGWWDNALAGGSLLATGAQGYMLGLYVMGLETDFASVMFGLVSAVGVTASYVLIGATWLVLKTEGELQTKAIRWSKRAIVISLLGILLVSLVNPMISSDVFERWFSPQGLPMAVATPLLVFGLFAISWRSLQTLPNAHDRGAAIPFFATVGIFLASFAALGFSFAPYIVPGKLLAVDAASSDAALRIILYGALVVLPLILLYTALSYWIFRGKAAQLSYE